MDKFWKNKKIIAYIALAHHTRFIIPVMASLQQMGATVKYIVGQAERSQEVTAINMGLPYAHIFDYITESDQDDIRENYSRLGKTFSQSLKRDFFLGILPVTVTDKTMLSTALEYVGFKNLFLKEKPDLCFALHEINRWGKLFAFWAKKNNVPFISLQEGLSYGLDFGLSGHAQFSTLNLVWGERIKKKLISFEAPEPKILAVGNTHLAREIAHQKTHGIRQRKRDAYGVAAHYICLLILSSRLPVPDLFFPLFKTISETRGQSIFVKFHPACKKDQITTWVEKIKKNYPNNNYFIHGEESTYDLISMADVVILGQKSTTGLETLAFGKPLIKLDFAYEPKAPYSFVDQGVALKMTAQELAVAIKEKTDFSKKMDSKRIATYLSWELADTETAIDRVCTIFQNCIQANRTRPAPLASRVPAAEKKWTIVIPVMDAPSTLLAQIEALAVNSRGGGPYETVFLVPDQISAETQTILDSLEGDIKRVQPNRDQNPIDALNETLTGATGQTLVFLSPGLAPLSGWLTLLAAGMARHDQARIFGARISDDQGKITHAGMVTDRNNSPVSAYTHLDINFEPALKERSFQMVDHFLAVDRELFAELGGLTPQAGEYMFLDFCLKAEEKHETEDITIYLPELQLIFLQRPASRRTNDHSIFFFSRWHGYLWASEDRLVREDKVSQEDLGRAQLSAAMKAFG